MTPADTEWLAQAEAELKTLSDERQFLVERVEDARQEHHNDVLSKPTIDRLDSSLRTWAEENAGLFLEENALLTEIAHRREAIKVTVSRLAPAPDIAQTEEQYRLALAVAQKIVLFASTYGVPGQSLKNALIEPALDGPTRELEFGSIRRDVQLLTDDPVAREERIVRDFLATVDAQLHEHVGRGLSEEDLNDSKWYWAHVVHGTMFVPGQADPVPPSSFDDHYRDYFGSDWAYGDARGEWGPSGTDHESYELADRRRDWLRARDLRSIERDQGCKAIPYGARGADPAMSATDRTQDEIHDFEAYSLDVMAARQASIARLLLAQHHERQTPLDQRLALDPGRSL